VVEIRRRLPEARVFTHLEPVEDPRSYDDEALDRRSAESSAPAPRAGP
jgi:hypothetical protein